MNLGECITEEDIIDRDGNLIGRMYTLWHCGEVVRKWCEMFPEQNRKGQK